MDARYTRVNTVSQERFNTYYLKTFNVIKEMVIMHCATIELYMYLGGLLSTQEARVTLSYRLTKLLRFFCD